MSKCSRKSRLCLSLIAATAVCCLLTAHRAEACGGLFCQFVPIDQAGEQIIFRQDGKQVTAVVLIQYEGEAEDFSWVVPVPGIPELSVGSEQVFTPLELVTRPQFILETVGQPCPSVFDGLPLAGGLGGAVPNSAAEDDGVVILERIAVGPFDVQVVSSDDPDALATWLTENNYDLTERGRDLIAPYVEENMNFVAVRLRQDRGVGDIQPLVMKYLSDEPTIPIRLTAVAALPDMGVIVWLLGPARAVPLNYLHVVPNYTRLNWYTGTFNAYASYQGLITAAMNEAGGQGFATDYAGRDLDVLSQLPRVATLTDELVRLSAVADDAEFVTQLAFGFVFDQGKITEILRRELPLPEGEDEFIYQVPELLRDVFTASQLTDARANIIIELNDTVIEPLDETLSVLDGDLYMTRLYTTLSAEEMTLDPGFSFNPDLDDQNLDRHARLDVNCGAWALTLGKGTGRDGERVIDGTGPPPGFSIVPPINQDAIWQTAMISTSGAPEIVTQKNFSTARISTRDDGSLRPRLCGLGLIPFLLFGIAFCFVRALGRPAKTLSDC